MFDRKVWKNCLFEILLLCLFVSIVSAYSGGTGTQADPYQIANVADLLTLAGTVADYNKYFILTADINMAGQIFTTAIIAPDTSTSSDFQGTAFTGTFDGSGHKITNFTINGGLYNSYIGLFGYISSGSVKNLGIENFSVNGASYLGGLVGNNSSGSITNCYSMGTVSSNLSGSSYIGGLVGYCSRSSDFLSPGAYPPSITNCYSTGSVSGDSYIGGLVGYNSSGNISSCYSECSVCGNSQYVGGLVGYGGGITACYSTGNVCGYYYVGGLVGYSGNITNSYSTGTVLGSGWLGGLVGYNKKSITKSYSTGTVIGYDQYLGGLVGYNDTGGSISNCYSTGEVDGSWTAYIGGLVGYNSSTVSKCYSTGAVSGIGSSNVGGLTGYGWASASFWDVNTSGRSSSAGGTGETTAQMKTISTFLSVGWDFIAVWDIDDGQTYPYIFKKTNYSGGNGTPAAPYQIANVHDLLTLANTVADYNKCFIQTADINMAGRASPIAIIAASTGTYSSFEGTVFSGTFDGNDHKITHFTINGGSNISYLGLFGRIDGGSVKNLGLENFSVSGTYLYIGGLAGRSLHGNITNCYSTGTVSGSSNSTYIGGLVGSNSTGNSITNCYSTGAVSGASGSSEIGGLAGVNSSSGSIWDCYSTGTVSGSLQVGDLAGYNSGTISNCYSTGAVSGNYGSIYTGGLVGYNYSGSITNCYSAGAVSGSGIVGGLVGYNYSGGSISNCYSTGVVSGSSYIGGLAGYNYGNISDCFSTGAIGGRNYIGGFTGINDSNITNCYSTGAVSGDSNSLDIGGLAGRHHQGHISNCYSIGAVSGSSNVGGLVGDINSGTVSASFWDVNSSGQAASAGGTGKTTAEMKTLSTFTSAGWDFVDETVNGPNDVWRMCVDGLNYPKLSWQFLPGDFGCPDGVDIFDLAVFSDHWLLEGSPYDINNDGIVNFLDFALLAENWLKQN
ncbi:MAG: GLUG motif-containing protein [Sedimentisphaerales bacterium]